MDESGFNWFERVIGTITFWAIVGNIAIVVFEVIPILGMLLSAVLMMTRIAFLVPHMITVGLVVDVVMKRLNPVFLLIPLFVYGCYYALYFSQLQQVETFAAQMRAQNAQLVLKYDPARHDIIFTEDRDAQWFVKQNKASVSYVVSNANPKSFRAVSVGVCSEMRAAGVFKDAWGDTPRCELISYYNYHGPRKGPHKVQLLVNYEKPSKEAINVLIGNPNEESSAIRASIDLRILKKAYRITQHGKELGKFITASYYRLPVFPFWAYACLSWERLDCDGGFYPSLDARHQIDTIPATVDRTVYGDNPVGIMLGVATYRDSQMSDFTPFPENEAIGRMLIEKKKNEKPEDFNAWGTRKDDARLPTIGERGGVPSYEGGIYVRQLGGPFYSFIRENEGKVVYIDARLDGSGNPGKNGFGLYGVCRKEEDCGRIDHYYSFINAGGSSWAQKELTVKGYWQVGVEEPVGNVDGDTRTQLQSIEAPQ
ncbi:MAG: hypothetical protein ACAH80_07385 [Alphaproteobacteria bacterium]